MDVKFHGVNVTYTNRGTKTANLYCYYENLYLVHPGANLSIETLRGSDFYGCIRDVPKSLQKRTPLAIFSDICAVSLSKVVYIEAAVNFLTTKSMLRDFIKGVPFGYDVDV
ncbi:hypothetical protein JR316_0000501 [Psilocybe cubensis]|uniref:Uncharacterized protein n=1 Tax=Psilocybe cubensis TaxID=181762 RepID=A0ACB8HF37_PSICU|nr:hypothetical protein JR316_0000501 [Psilocybe cubensis]KAH9486436.1 hypothetical protein JR316_0000501 [Psilocybe cubensis]